MENNLKKALYVVKRDHHLLKFVVNQLFEWEELAPELSDVDSSTGNINCPFHIYEKGSVNKSQSAKVYYNEEFRVHTITCFTFKKSYTCYDYIRLILQYDPYDFLLEYRNESDILGIMDALDKNYIPSKSKFREKLQNHINNAYNESNANISDFIEKIFKD